MSDETLVETVRREAAELRLDTELRVARAARAAMELEVLNSRDFAVGQAAQIGELRHRLVKQAARLELHRYEFEIHATNYRQHIARLEAALAEATSAAAQADRLRREIIGLRASAAWRLGRFLLLPIRVMKRLLRRG